MASVSRSGRCTRIAGAVFALATFASAWAASADSAASGPENAAATPTKQVTWAVYDAAPYMMTDGPAAGTGIADRVRRILMDRLTDYTHNVIVAPFPRVVSSLKQGAEWCFLGGIRTEEREAFAYFSRPTGMFYPLRIMVRAGQAKRFEALAPLSLRHLLQDHPELRTSVLRNRALAPNVDAILRQSPPTQMHSEFSEAFRMLQNDRLDYLIEFSNIALYYAKSLGDTEGWVGLPLVETPEPVFSRVMCARTPWGRAIIDRIDAILAAERVTDPYRRTIEAWSADEDLPKLRAAYDSSFLSSE
jgi:polar amino acid transport system substrate-binding protein